MSSKTENTLDLGDMGQLKILVESDEGFIKNIKFDGPLQTNPEAPIEHLEEHLKWAHLTPVAIYTRLRFFMLKNKVDLVGVDCQKLADAIAECAKEES